MQLRFILLFFMYSAAFAAEGDFRASASQVFACYKNKSGKVKYLEAKPGKKVNLVGIIKTDLQGFSLCSFCLTQSEGTQFAVAPDMLKHGKTHVVVPRSDALVDSVRSSAEVLKK